MQMSANSGVSSNEPIEFAIGFDLSSSSSLNFDFDCGFGFDFWFWFWFCLLVSGRWFRVLVASRSALTASDALKPNVLLLLTAHDADWRSLCNRRNWRSGESSRWLRRTASNGFERLRTASNGVESADEASAQIQ